ncbi:MAG: electron transfer flavoprotein subunit alpha [Erysipelotrichaceae bacterium]
MSGIIINHDLCVHCNQCIKACPFNALEVVDGNINVNAACKMCQVCIKQCPVHAISIEKEEKKAIDKTKYKGILVYVEHEMGDIHPVTLELVGKALELAKIVSQDVYCLFIGHQIEESAKQLLEYGVRKVFVYEEPSLTHFKVDSYANLFEDCILKLKPHTVLVGATTTGRSLAPRVATRLHTGLTADCTILQMRENTDLIQTRPAFGGNIMAQIITTNHRPQFATVRYKVMNHATKVEHPNGEVILQNYDPKLLESKIEILNVSAKPKEVDIAASDVLVVAGNAIKDEKGMALIEELANHLGGIVAVTRPLVEKGFKSCQYQIGLSGRTVKPKLIITCGVSGAIQFVAGMNQSETIIAINTDEQAPIFKVAHHAVIGDIYEIIPMLIEKIKGGQ